ncbi:MAG: class I SAM-dependent methyltransferase [Kiritimatiellales bacterium]|nr:class I SAM-dependent methyltransferase [Kiritimatiellales bacterium]
MKEKLARGIGYSAKCTRGVLGLFVLLSATATTVMAQEESVRPGINVKYQAPNVKRSINSFEKEKREIYANRENILALLDLKAGMDAADVGAGTGFFSRMMARKVAPGGTVYSVDIAANFIAHITKTAQEESLTNLKAVLCDEKSTHLAPASVDVVFVCDTYHHFEYPYETLKSIHQALRPGGVLVIIDFERIRGISPEKRCQHVRCGKGTVTDEVKDSGFDFLEEIPMMKEQWIRRFKKR